MTLPLVRIAILGLSAVVLTSYVLNPPGPQKLRAAHSSVNGDAGTAITAEALPICSAMGLSADSGDWAALDPDFVNGKRAMAAGDRRGAVHPRGLGGIDVQLIGMDDPNAIKTPLRLGRILHRRSPNWVGGSEALRYPRSMLTRKWRTEQRFNPT